MENSKKSFRENITERLLEFPARIIKVEGLLCKTYAGKHIYGQLFRSGTSSGANYEESIAAESKADFIHKTQVVLKEIRESNYWLRLIKKSKLLNEDNSDFKFLLQESYEFIKIFSSSLVTAKNNRK
ncbi:MAG: four helix bundle protein [Bacteroidetes bacterium]|nr:four helix bundle protein [Bacteroidota bacterium]